MTTMYELAQRSVCQARVSTPRRDRNPGKQGHLHALLAGRRCCRLRSGRRQRSFRWHHDHGNYPGRAATPEQLMADFEKAASLIPGKKRINLHASYAIFTEENPWVDRDKLEYKHFEPWVTWAKKERLRHRLQPHLVQPPAGKGRPYRFQPRKRSTRFLDPSLHRLPPDRRAHRRGNGRHGPEQLLDP